jgi:hypothetical protein
MINKLDQNSVSRKSLGSERSGCSKCWIDRGMAGGTSATRTLAKDTIPRTDA